MMKLIVSKAYMNTRDAAPEALRWELEDLETELRRNRLRPGRKPENVRCNTGETLQSYRVNNNWRLITYQWKEDELLLLLVGSHDEIYRQARNLSVEWEKGVPLISDSAEGAPIPPSLVHVATPALLTTIRKALGETLEVFSRRFIKPNGEPYDAGSLGVYSTDKKPISDSVDAAFRQALPALLQSETMNLDGRPAVLAAIMENVRRRREALGLSIKEFAKLIDYPMEAYRQAEGVYIHNDEPRRCTARYLIPILENLSVLEAEQKPERPVNEEAITVRLDELEVAVGTLRQTVDTLSETLAALREAMRTK